MDGDNSATTPVDFDEIKALAEQGNFEAQYQLALMYEYGDGVKQNYAQAVYWHRQAAEQGHSEAQHNLGAMYADGRGVPKDGIIAIHWWRKAAERDIIDLQYNLGKSYDKGRDYLIQELCHILYSYNFQHRLIPIAFWSNPEEVLKDLYFDHYERFLLMLIVLSFKDAITRGTIKFEDKNELCKMKYCIEKPHWLLLVCIDCMQLFLGKKIILEKHSYLNIDAFILKFISIDIWSPTLCERVYFLSNKERSRFALYTIEMANRDSEKSPFGRVSIESHDMGKFMICEHTKDGRHANYGTAPVGEKAVSNKIFGLFCQTT